jgi:hypothetical protein
MKKIFLSLAIAAAVFSSASAYAAGAGPGFLVKEAFAREFAGIKEVKWKPLGQEDIYEASFIFKNEELHAYFSEEGVFLGTTRQISRSQLPILVTMALENKYGYAKIATVFEYSMINDLAYYITLYSEKGSLIVKAAGSGQLTVYKRIKQKG